MFNVRQCWEHEMPDDTPTQLRLWYNRNDGALVVEYCNKGAEHINVSTIPIAEVLNSTEFENPVVIIG
jgi:hypothetical protein